LTLTQKKKKKKPRTAMEARAACGDRGSPNRHIALFYSAPKSSTGRQPIAAHDFCLLSVGKRRVRNRPPPASIWPTCVTTVGRTDRTGPRAYERTHDPRFSPTEKGFPSKKKGDLPGSGFGCASGAGNSPFVLKWFNYPFFSIETRALPPPA